jgi:Helix-turn-helix.
VKVKMTIGDLLKQYRINQNKTLQEFAGNIIDRSYYGKVERNVHQISAENLINLLRYNQIDDTEFIETLDQNYQSQIQIQRKIMEEAYYHVDKDKLKKLN